MSDIEFQMILTKFEVGSDTVCNFENLPCSPFPLLMQVIHVVFLVFIRNCLFKLLKTCFMSAK